MMKKTVTMVISCHQKAGTRCSYHLARCTVLSQNVANKPYNGDSDVVPVTIDGNYLLSITKEYW